MSDPKPQKVVYLFGAGATHAELTNIQKDLSENFFEKRGLLIDHVSRRVIQKARDNKRYMKNIDMVSAPTGSPNIELLITLIESSRVKDSEWKTHYLKRLVKNDITSILTKSKRSRFYLHRALLELHKQSEMEKNEKLLGLVSLNYDNVLDEAYKVVYGQRPIYYHTLTEVAQYESIPLLKLHGSFNWINVPVRGRRRSFEIIPLGANKNYWHVPYNYIWSKALEIVTQCDILRVVGCSLSPNDIHLIDLLFKAHLERGAAFEIQIISKDEDADNIRRRYGFLSNIKRLSEIEPASNPKADNPFEEWLKNIGTRMLREGIKRTSYLRKLVA
jgi:hypothetical protein